VHEAAVICAGFGGVIDVKGTSMALDVPLYEMATDIPLPHAHHTGQKMRMDKYVAFSIPPQHKEVSITNQPFACRRCFNCGLQDHMLTECPEPRDNGRITANRNVSITPPSPPGLYIWLILASDTGACPS
jgi:hypothetical protein